MGENVVRKCGLETVFNDRQVDGHAGLDVEHGVGLGLVHVVCDTVDTLGLAEFLVARRPQVETTVNGKEVVLYIERSQWVVGDHSTEAGLTGCVPETSLDG